MKKEAAMLATMLGAFLFAVPVYATESNSVWVTTEADWNKEKGESVRVYVSSDGKTTDGLVTITYDGHALELSSNDVIPGKGIDLYSVNTDTDGKVLISYIAKENVPSGTMFTLDFEVEGKVDVKNFACEGTVHDMNGGILTVASEVHAATASENNSGNNSSNNTNNNTNNNSNNISNNNNTTTNNNNNVNNTQNNQNDSEQVESELPSVEGSKEDTTEKSTEETDVKEDTTEVPALEADASNMPVAGWIIGIAVAACVLVAVAAVILVRKRGKRNEI